jgi:hypothetical protein
MLHNATALSPEKPYILIVPQAMGKFNIRTPLLGFFIKAYLRGSLLDVAKMSDGPSSSCLFFSINEEVHKSRPHMGLETE